MIIMTTNIGNQQNPIEFWESRCIFATLNNLNNFLLLFDDVKQLF